MQAVLDHIEPLSSHIITFWFKPEKPMRYVAGQFTEIRLPHAVVDVRGDKRWFTLSSSPTEPLVSITTKFSEPGSSFKQTLASLKPGTVVNLAEAMGDFVLPKDKSIPLLFVIGGMGVTPLRSMVKWLNDTKERRSVHIIYAANRFEDFVFLDLFKAYGVKLELILTDPPAGWEGLVGHITAEKIDQLAEGLNEKRIYISGPEPMIEALNDSLLDIGVHKNQLVTDYFPGYDTI